MAALVIKLTISDGDEFRRRVEKLRANPAMIEQELDSLFPWLGDVLRDAELSIEGPALETPSWRLGDFVRRLARAVQEVEQEQEQTQPPLGGGLHGPGKKLFGWFSVGRRHREPQ